MNSPNAAAAKFFEVKNAVGGATLTLASKNVKTDFLLEFIKKTGHLEYGENYASELAKWDAILPQYPNIKLSFIGAFQTGNLKKIVKYCGKIQTAQSLAHLHKIRAEAAKQGKSVQVYAQINIGMEPQKSGFAPSVNPSELVVFDGLMCIPPANLPPLKFFEQMRELKQKSGVKNLSMGMSGDYFLALECGSTEVRIGSLIFK